MADSRPVVRLVRHALGLSVPPGPKLFFQFRIGAAEDGDRKQGGVDGTGLADGQCPDRYSRLTICAAARRLPNRAYLLLLAKPPSRTP